MGLSLLPFPQPHTPSQIHPLHTLFFSPTFSIRSKRIRKAPTVALCRCSSSSSGDSAKAELAPLPLRSEGRRALLACLLLSAAGACVSDAAQAVSTSRRALRGEKIPESDFKTLPNGLKYYDIKVGGGPEAVKGSRVAVHYVAKWKGITFMTSRQGLGVGGGTPYGFDVGQSERGTVLKGLDLGVQGMRVGGQRLLIVPPELAYGSKGVQEIPPNATIELDLELLSIKQSPFGSPVKIVEG
ncbi:hypothetical protein BT93_L1854 [Corymbia citriodora subsp. variegata]|uniref:peptidylprolyl isomerase n=1 Tax=Corymbia citriodora subsp. variegata TaxID=360336 RepID=A0A8T0CLI7_CORYI|nr:hypothetical protein BT93_L1854 [Corymbia citriodora subsp. variegata]